MDKTTKPYTYQPDVCRSLYTSFNDTITTDNGILLYGYGLDEFIFANVSVNPYNEGFCTPNSGNCLVSGLINMTNCIKIGNFNSPVYMSMPHYLFGSDELVNNITGLKPDYYKHRTIVYFEPRTGVLMKANKRIQMSTRTIKDDRITITQNLTELYFPLFWIDENFNTSQLLTNTITSLLTRPLTLFSIFKYGLVGVGCCLFILFLVFHMAVCRRRIELQLDEQQSLINSFIRRNDEDSYHTDEQTNSSD
jgi:hypothetical protein